MHSIKLKIGQNEHKFNFGLRFLGELLDEAEMGVEEVVEKLQSNPFKMIPLIMFVSAKYGAKSEKKDIGMDYDGFVDYMDENGGLGQPSVKEFITAFVDSLTSGVPNVEEQVVDEEEAKKK